MTSFQQGIVALTRAAFTGEVSAIPSDFSLEKIDVFAKKHQISSVLLYGIIAAGLGSVHPVVNKLYVFSSNEILINEKQVVIADKIANLFNSNNISFVFLKGSVIKSMYPKPEMRVMGDIDILIKQDEYKNIKKVLIENGFSELYESDHELAWKAENGTIIELHKALMPSYHDGFNAYFGDGWKLADKSENSTEHHFSAEDHFLYIFTHFAKHYKAGGIGIKHLVDLWIYKRNFPELDINLIETELEKLDLLTFYQNVIQTEKVWFEGAESGEITNAITATIINSGAYGTHDARVNAETLRVSRSKNKNISKFRILMRKIFPSASVLSAKYKFLRKCKLLLPIAWIIRWFDAVLNKRDNIKLHAQDIKNTDESKILGFEKELALVGLKYNTKENL